MIPPTAAFRPPPHARRLRALRRALPWTLLIALLLVALSSLVWLASRYEDVRSRNAADRMSATVATNLRQLASDNVIALDSLVWGNRQVPTWAGAGNPLLRKRRYLLRIEQRGLDLGVVQALETPYELKLFPGKEHDADDEPLTACTQALHQRRPVYSLPFVAPAAARERGIDAIDLCLPIRHAGVVNGFMVATYDLEELLRTAAGPNILRRAQVHIVDAQNTRIATVGDARGTGAYTVRRSVALPGATLEILLDSGTPSVALIPSLAVGLMLGLSLAVLAAVGLLARDMRHRARAEAALAESLAFRRAMEDSMLTGLCARNLEGRITLANLAFCRMVGGTPEGIVGQDIAMFWPESAPHPRPVLPPATTASRATSVDTENGFETTFRRSTGESFHARVYDAPLLDESGRHTGWLSTVLDVTRQRDTEELARQQRERLQATARLAVVGEMASLLSHELNQPLFAITSYANGSLNMARDQRPDAETVGLLREAIERIAVQAERAGRVIRSVHDFVRRRDSAVEPVACQVLIDAVLPLVSMQARKSDIRVVTRVEPADAAARCDRTMIEQVILNLSRNALQAMEEADRGAGATLRIEALLLEQAEVLVRVIDHGPGLSAEAEAQLFTPFFTTKPQGMGLGLSLCRTVAEQHGGRLRFARIVDDEGRAATEFSFTLPSATAPRRGAPAARPRPLAHETQTQEESAA